jgi:snRNA-activating protein complex subunit 3
MFALNFSPVITNRNIIDWAQDNARDRISEKTYTAAMMADTTFEDLTFQMDVPYLFVHHGNCEHIIRFKEVR